LSSENNILSPQLQQLSIEPPAHLFGSIMSKISSEDAAFDKSLKTLGNFAVAPAFSFGSVMDKIKQADDLNSFKPLRQYEVEPPFSFARIMELIKNALNVSVSNKPLAPVISMPLLKRALAVAAAVLVAVFAYVSFSKKAVDDSNEGIVSTNNPSVTQPSNGIINDTVDVNINPLNNVLMDKNQNNSLATNRKGRENLGGRKKMVYGKNASFSYSSVVDSAAESFNIAGINTPMVDNDFLATFASFNENTLPAFLQSETPISTVITVDQFTDIVVTDKMGAFMKKMYKTKRSGKPTRKAKKAKQKLEKWKVADSTYFSNETINNPLNPIDLGNFILKK
jgi:hypothetical protein